MDMELVDQFGEKNCNGCRVCADICPHGAVSFRKDALTGFDLPTINGELCVQCGLCAKKCPQNHPVRVRGRGSEKVYAAWTTDDEIRLLCTSGGIFFELAAKMIEMDGVVVACAYTKDFRAAYHCEARTVKDLRPLCGSKHVQSETLHIYQRVRTILTEEEKPVLFVGTPCQVAALYRFLGEEPRNLLTVDFICNSINSPKAQGRYIDYLEEIYNSRIVFARAKDKRYGWNHFGSSARFENGKEYYAESSRDPRVVGYHHGHLFVRESCFHCQYKILPRNADLTLGDFWGIEKDPRNPKLELGTSLVIANSEKGKLFFAEISGRAESYEKTVEDALRGNPSLLKSASASPKRREAFEKLNVMRFDRVVNRYKDNVPLWKIIGHRVKRMLTKKG